MKNILIFISLFSFGALSQESPIEIVLSGNPKCLLIGEKYKLLVRFKEESNKKIILSASGLSLTKSKKNKDVYFINAISSDDEKASISVSLKDLETNKTEIIENILYTICNK